jgi:Predicted metal-dependent hydrolase
MLYDLSLPLRGAEARSEHFNQRDSGIARLGHVGTHLDRVLGTTVPLDYFRSRGLLFDVSGFCGEREVLPGDISLETVQRADFILFRTGYLTAHGYGTPPYMQAFFALSWKLIDALLDKDVHFIGLDARGVRPNEEHKEADSRCERRGVFVIENLNTLEVLPREIPFTAFVMCFDAGGSGVPCRVIAETD